MSVSDVATREQEFLSKEQVEGDRLSDRLADGILPPEDSLRIALDIGTALHRAHARGLVHGALSPAAILLTSDGAILLQPQSVAPELCEPYRAPEQVRGEPADWRSDIFSYGAVLYELVSGRRPFPGSGLELDEAIVRRPSAALNAKTPIHAAMEGVIAGCMQKDPAARRQRMQNAVTELKLAGRSAPQIGLLTQRLAQRTQSPAAPADPAETGQFLTVPAPADPLRTVFRQPTPVRPRRLALAMVAIIALAAVAIAALAIIYLRRDRSANANQVLRFRISPPQPAGYCGTPAVSPDGHYVACAAPGEDGQPVLWLHAFDETKWVSVNGSDGAFAPFWSPDSRFVGFFAKGLLKRVALGNGAPGTAAALCETEGTGGGATWSSGGAILFAPGQEGGLSRIASSGGKPQPVLKPNAQKSESAFLWPQFLPDGKHFVFFLQTNLPETSGVAVGSLDPPSYRFLFQSDSNAVYSTTAGAHQSSNGYLLFIQDRNLMGQEFNPSKQELVGQSNLLAPEIGLISSLSLAPLSVSGNAMLTYQKVDEPTRQLVWMERSGRPIRTVGDAGKWGPPRISPDGHRVAAGKMGADGRNSDLWLIEEDGAANLFLATPGVSHGMPMWSPDGKRLAYWSNQSGVYDIYDKPVEGNGKEELLYQSSLTKYPTDWTRDGKFILFGAIGDGTKSDIWALSLPDRHASPLVQTIHAEGYAAISPDGRWMAYQSDETGANEIYVQPFEPGSSETKRRVQVSNDGGGIPRWSADGGELFYMTGSGHMMAVTVHSRNGLFEFDPPKMLFHTRPMRPFSNLYDVSPDGQRFLINAPLERTTPSSGANNSDIMVVTNWTERLK
jgi:Tol biopolymer transport system component